MTTARTRATDLLVIDMSTIRFQWNRQQSACAALTSRGELVALVDMPAAGPGQPDVDARELAFTLLDTALERGHVLRADPLDPSQRVMYRLAWYNPFTAEVSMHAVPDTVTFTDGDDVDLPSDGLPAKLTGVRSPQLALPGERVLLPRELTLRAATRLPAMHLAA